MLKQSHALKIVGWIIASLLGALLTYGGIDDQVNV